jgi:splicing factor 3B subunit 1
LGVIEAKIVNRFIFFSQEQTTEDVVMLNGFGTIVNSLGKRVKPYLPQICGTILWRLNNKSAKVRQQAADLISRIAVVMKTCQEEKLMGHLGVSWIISCPSLAYHLKKKLQIFSDKGPC